MRILPLLAVAAFAALAAAGCMGKTDTTTTSVSSSSEPSPPYVPLAWGVPVDLKAIGYEPSLACDSKDTMFVTAHKDLNRPDTWPYLASWILVSDDHGATWHAPGAPGGLPVNAAQQFVGDEGDLAIDARDWMYYVDTTLADTWVHVWSDHGKTWESSLPGRSSQTDDRPWIFAQGDGIVHYLGNNGVTVPGERYIYYRSTDGGMTWSTGTGLPFDGWAHGDAQRNGTMAYVTQEDIGTGDLNVLVSSDSGATWGDPVKMGTRKGGDADGPYAVISVTPDGNATAAWIDSVAGKGHKGTRVVIAQTFDRGKTWNATDVTPVDGFYDHATVATGAHGEVGVAFYGTNDTNPTPTSEWRLWAGMGRGKVSGAADLGLAIADPKVLWTGNTPPTTGGLPHGLHDFFEACVDNEGALDIAYMTNLAGGPPNATDGDRHLWFVRGVQPLSA